MGPPREFCPLPVQEGLDCGEDPFSFAFGDTLAIGGNISVVGATDYPDWFSLDSRCPANAGAAYVYELITE